MTVMPSSFRGGPFKNCIDVITGKATMAAHPKIHYSQAPHIKKMECC